MDESENRLDDLARSVAEGGHSRRSVLKMGAVAVGGLFAALPGRAWAGQPQGNDACAEFCNLLFPPGPQRGACKSAAAHGTGPCFECGPLAPPGHPELCVNVCCKPGEVCCNGKCTPACTPPFVLNPTNCKCECPGGTSTCGNECCSATQVCCNDHCVEPCTAPKVLDTTTCTCVCPTGTTTCGDTCCAAGETCQNGTCVAGPPPHPECTGATCSTFTPCSSANPNCVCGSVVDVTGAPQVGICVPGSTPCSSLTPCSGVTGFECPSNSVCAVNSCCGQPVCVPISLTELCPSVTTSGVTLMTTASASGPTFG